MRYTNVLAFGFAVLSGLVQPAVAQLSALPACAAICFESAIKNQTTCAPTDTHCICTDAALVGAVEVCLGATCTVRETLTAVNVTNTMCGVPARDRTNTLLITSIVAGTVALLSVIVRTSVAVMQRSFGLDDFFAIAAEAACLPTTLMQCYTPHLGFGKDTWAVPQGNIYEVLKLVYASQVSYFPCSGFTKLTFLFFFLRIFPAKNMKKTIYIFVGLSVLYTVGFWFTIIFACKPISAVWTAWDGTKKPDYCINQNKFYLVAAGVNIALDIAIVLIPIPELMKLKLSLRKKIFLVAIFCVGGVTIVVSCIRLSALAIYATSTNPLYDNMMAGVYSVLEMNVGIICICMPSFRRFLAHLVPSCFASTQDDSKYKPYDNGTPNARISTSKKSGRSRKRSTMDGSLFNTTIMKTVDTRVESAIKEDDEVHLVDLHKNGKVVTESLNGSTEGRDLDRDQKPVTFYHGS